MSAEDHHSRHHEKDRVKHSYVGLTDKHQGGPKKDGAGGKFTWGSAGVEDGDAAMDKRDPNYDSGDDESGEVEFVYKILPQRELEAAKHSGSVQGSELDQKDGFIHLSSARQVIGTTKKFFKGVDDLYLMEIDATQIKDKLRWEKAADRPNDAEFPHCYGGISMKAVVRTYKLSLKKDGSGFHDFPEHLEAM